ncbi:hypothetical protein M231_07123 [Tremella mesenterica]|uniref:Uncharacterized protein n=1 Tax=Tremella mesenterica TaxID=5217 RepID=A0A4Q1BFZ0_TREME|nr:hypothetical protein M231_07123 [Tremella mesenterica]
MDLDFDEEGDFPEDWDPKVHIRNTRGPEDVREVAPRGESTLFLEDKSRLALKVTITYLETGKWKGQDVLALLWRVYVFQKDNRQGVEAISIKFQISNPRSTESKKSVLPTWVHSIPQRFEGEVTPEVVEKKIKIGSRTGFNVVCAADASAEMSRTSTMTKKHFLRIESMTYESPQRENEDDTSILYVSGVSVLLRSGSKTQTEGDLVIRATTRTRYWSKWEGFKRWMSFGQQTSFARVVHTNNLPESALGEARLPSKNFDEVKHEVWAEHTGLAKVMRETTTTTGTRETPKPSETAESGEPNGTEIQLGD